MLKNIFPGRSRGLTVGLFGGSFNMPHAGHALVADQAIQKLSLDRLLWLVSPGNPLKSHHNLAPLVERIEFSKALVKNNRIIVTGLEQVLSTIYSFDTLVYLKTRYPEINFVWVMGADSMATFHKWRFWKKIVCLVPILIVNRPYSTYKALNSPMAQTFARYRVLQEGLRTLPFLSPPAWGFVFGSLSYLSSSELR